MHVPGFAADIGAWCNGNTWVSKTFVVSSNLTAPAIQPISKEIGCFHIICIGGISVE